MKKSVRLSSLKCRSIISCGCYHKETVTTHGMSRGGERHPLYTVYDSMIQRCYSKNHILYKRHGARGIKVCREWLDNKNVFFAWASDKWKPGLWIERIDNNGNYTPKNCTFSTPRDNTNNRECSRTWMFKGKKSSIFEISEAVGIDSSTLLHRLGRGLSLQEAIKYKLNKSEAGRKSWITRRGI
jgi:hypothetical protein